MISTFPGNPHALFINNIVTEVVFMQNYSEEEINAELDKHTYDFVLTYKDAGQEIYVGQEMYKEKIRDESPYLSWLFNEDSWLWEPPVPRPSNGNTYYWVEENLGWELCVPCESHETTNVVSELPKETVNAN